MDGEEAEKGDTLTLLSSVNDNTRDPSSQEDSALWTQLCECRKELSASRSAYDALLKDEVTPLRLELVRLKGESQQWQSEKKELLRKEFRLLECNNQVMSEIESISQSMVKLKESSNDECSKLRTQNEELKHTIARMKREEQEKTAQIRSEARESCRKELWSLKESMNEQSAELMRIREEHSSMKLKMSLKDNEAGFLKEQMTTMKMQSQKQRDFLQRENELLSDTNDSFRNEIVSLKTSLDSMKSQMMVQSEQLRSVQSTFDCYKKSSENEMSNVQSKWMHCQTVLKSTQMSLSEQTAENERLELRLEDLRQLCSLYETKVSNLDQISSQLRDDKLELVEKCEKIKRDPMQWQFEVGMMDSQKKKEENKEDGHDYSESLDSMTEEIDLLSDDNDSGVSSSMGRTRRSYQSKYIEVCRKYRGMYTRLVSLQSEMKQMQSDKQRTRPLIQRRLNELQSVQKKLNKSKSQVLELAKQNGHLKSDKQNLSERLRMAKMKIDSLYHIQNKLTSSLAKRMDATADDDIEDDPSSSSLSPSHSRVKELVESESTEQLCSKYLDMVEQLRTCEMDNTEKMSNVIMENDKLKGMLAEAIEARDSVAGEMERIRELYESFERKMKKKQEKEEEEKQQRQQRQEVGSNNTIQLDRTRSAQSNQSSSAILSSSQHSSEMPSPMLSFSPIPESKVANVFGDAQSSGLRSTPLDAISEDPENEDEDGINDDDNEDADAQPSLSSVSYEKSLLQIQQTHDEFVESKLKEMSEVKRQLRDLEFTLGLSKEEIKKKDRQLDEFVQQLAAAKSAVDSTQIMFENEQSKRKSIAQDFTDQKLLLEQTQEELASLKSKMDFEKKALDLKVEGMQQQLEQFHQSRKQLSDELMQAQKLIGELELLNIRQQTELEKLQNTIMNQLSPSKTKISNNGGDQMNNNIEARDSSVEVLSDNEDGSNHTTAQQQSREDADASTSAAAQVSPADQEAWAADLKEMLTKNQKQFTENMREKMHLISEISRLESKLRETETKMARMTDFEDKASQLEVELSKTQRELSETRSKLTTETQRNTDMSGVMKELERVMQIHRPRMTADEMDQALKDLEQVRKDNEQLCNQMSELNGSNESLTQENNALQSKIIAYSSQSDECDQLISAMKDRLVSMAADLDLSLQCTVEPKESSEVAEMKDDSNAVAKSPPFLCEMVRKLDDLTEKLLNIMKDRVMKAKERENELESEYQQRCDELETMKKQYENEVTEHSETTSRMAGMRTEVIEMRDQLNKVNDEKLELSVSFEKMKEESQSMISQLQSERNDLKKQVNEMIEEQTVLNANMKLLNEQLESLRTAKDFDVNVVEPSAVKSSKSSSNEKEKDDDEEEESTMVDGLKRHISELTRSLERNKKNYFDEMNKHSDTKSSLNVTRNELADLRHEFELQSKTLSSLMNQSNHSDGSDNADADSTMDSSSASMMSLNTTPSKKHSDFLKSLSESSKMYEMNKNLKKRVQLLSKETEQQKKSLRELTIENKSLENQIKVVTNGVQSLNVLGSEKEAAQKKLMLIQQQLSKKTEGFKKAKELLNKAKVENQQMSEQMSEMNGKYNELLVSYNEMESTMNQIKSECEEYRSNLSNAEKNLNDVLSNDARKNEEMNTLKQTISELKKKLSSDESSSSSNSVLESSSSKDGKRSEDSQTNWEEKFRQALKLVKSKTQNESDLKRLVDRQRMIVQKMRTLIEKQRGELNLMKQQMQSDHMGNHDESMMESQKQEIEKYKKKMKKQSELVAQLRADAEEFEGMMNTMTESQKKIQLRLQSKNEELESIKGMLSDVQQSLKQAEKDLKKQEDDHQAELHRIHSEHAQIIAKLEQQRNKEDEEDEEEEEGDDNDEEGVDEAQESSVKPADDPEDDLLLLEELAANEQESVTPDPLTSSKVSGKKRSRIAMEMAGLGQPTADASSAMVDDEQGDDEDDVLDDRQPREKRVKLNHASDSSESNEDESDDEDDDSDSDEEEGQDSDEIVDGSEEDDFEEGVSGSESDFEEEEEGEGDEDQVDHEDGDDPEDDPDYVLSRSHSPERRLASSGRSNTEMLDLTVDDTESEAE